MRVLRQKYKVDALKNSFQIVQTQIEPLSSEFAGLGKKYHRELARLGSLMYEKVTELSGPHAEVSGLIRGELGLDVDLEKMKQEQKKQDEEARQAMQNLFEKVEREYYDGEAM